MTTDQTSPLRQGVIRKDAYDGPVPEGVFNHATTPQGELNNFNKMLLGYSKGRIIPVSPTKIAYIYSSSSMVYVKSLQHGELLTKCSLDGLERRLDPALFHRANRQFIISRHHIDYIEPYFNRRLLVKVNVPTPEKIIISKAKTGCFLQWLQG